MRRMLLILFALAAAVCVSFYPQTADAHSLLERTVPNPNTRLEAGPPKVELGFNEAIEAGVGSVRVLDSKSNL